MRRPLCLIGLVYVAAIWILVYFRPGGSAADSLSGEQVVVAGYVDRKEYRLSRGVKTPVLYLSDAVILEQNQTAILERFLSDSEKIPKSSMYHLWKEKRDILRRKDSRATEGVLCYMRDNKLPKTGSLVMVRGTYRAFLHATNPGEFDAAVYYGIAGQQGRTMDSILLTESAAYDHFRETLYRIRTCLSLLLDACYDERDASVMKAMLLGEKGMLDAELKELYQASGIVHILAVSGLHLSVIGMGLHKLLKRVRMPYAVNIIFCISLMYCYGMMTGMGTSMIRAYVMFALHLFAGLAGRTYDLMTAVTVSALIILLQQPLYLRHSGFLFSFGAVCGIGILLPVARTNMLDRGRAVQAVLSGAVITVATLPVYLCYYYEFPPYSVLLNLIVIPCMTFVLLCGLLSLGAAACSLSLGAAISVPTHILLWFYEKCCAVCLYLPGNIWSVGRPALWQILLFFGILLVTVVWNERIPKLLFWQGILCALVAVGIRMAPGLQITMVDVGQGECIYLSEESGMRMLIDGGSSDKSDVAKYQIVPFLKYEGVTRLDAVVVTHPDDDHISGICAILEDMPQNRFEIGALCLPDVGEAGRNEAYRRLERLAARAGVPVRYIGYGDSLRCGEVMLTCIHPEKGWNTEESNAYSTVLRLSYGNFTALFTGDLEGLGERRVEELVEANESLQNITMLKVAHHGSGNSTGERFLCSINPKIALISAGKDNRYGHPHGELLERLRRQGCLVRCTQESGAVTVRVRGGKVIVNGYVD